MGSEGLIAELVPKELTNERLWEETLRMCPGLCCQRRAACLPALPSTFSFFAVFSSVGLSAFLPVVSGRVEGASS